MNPYKTFLDLHHISYEKYDHQAVFTVEEAHRFINHIPGQKTKNVFLRNRSGNAHYLCVVPAEITIDTNQLAKLFKSSRLSFASAERLKTYLNVDPGSVSLLSIYNDKNQDVQLYIDDVIWNSSTIQCHPGINTSTLVIQQEGVRTFIDTIPHEAHIINFPRK